MTKQELHRLDDGYLYASDQGAVHLVKDPIVTASLSLTQGNVQSIIDDTFSSGQAGTSAIYFGSGNAATGTTKFAWTCPYAGGGTIIAAVASVGTAPTGASILVDINKNGTTIFTTQSNRVTIAAAATTGVGTPQVTSVSYQDRITFDIDQIGSGTVGADLSVVLLIDTYGS